MTCIDERREDLRLFEDMQETEGSGEKMVEKERSEKWYPVRRNDEKLT